MENVQLGITSEGLGLYGTGQARPIGTEFEYTFDPSPNIPSYKTFRYKIENHLKNDKGEITGETYKCVALVSDIQPKSILMIPGRNPLMFLAADEEVCPHCHGIGKVKDKP